MRRAHNTGHVCRGIRSCRRGAMRPLHGREGECQCQRPLLGKNVSSFLHVHVGGYTGTLAAAAHADTALFPLSPLCVPPEVPDAIKHMSCSFSLPQLLHFRAPSGKQSTHAAGAGGIELCWGRN